MKPLNLSFWLVLLMSMMSMNATAHDIAVENSDGLTIYYNWINDNTELAVAYQGSSCDEYPDRYSGVVSIPQSVLYEGTSYPVTCIGYDAFSECSNVTSIIIPNSITFIDAWAFHNCSGLTSVLIPKSVINIEWGAFQGCSGLTSISVESGNPQYDSRSNCNAIIVTGEDYLLFGCMNTVIPNTVAAITSGAFAQCSGLTNILIPESVTLIEQEAFSGCFNLANISVESGNPQYDSRNNCNAIIETASNTLVVGCKNTVIPNTVTTIGDRSFAGCSELTSITIPNSVEEIKDNAFENCSRLESVTLGNSISVICNRVFEGCNNIRSLILEGSVPPQINDYYGDVFDNRNEIILYVHKEDILTYSLTKYWQDFKDIWEIGKDYTGPREYADGEIRTNGTFTWPISENVTMTFKVIDYEGRKVQVGKGRSIDNTYEGDIIIPATVNGYSVIKVGSSAFSECSKISFVSFPESIMEIDGLCLFMDCSRINNIVLPVPVKNYTTLMFAHCSSLNNLTTTCVAGANIESYAFEGTAFESFVIPNGVKAIAHHAFSSCRKMKSVVIPNTVTDISGGAFAACENLKSVTSLSENPTEIGEGAFDGSYSRATLYVPVGTVDLYRNTAGWSQFLNIVEMGSGPVANYTDNQGVIYTLDNESMTYSVTGHTDDFNLNVVIPSTLFDLPVTRIGDDALGWSELESVVLPEGIVTIGMNAISDCQISSLYIPSTVTSLYPNDDNPFSCNQQLSQIQVAEGNTIYDSREGCNAIIETATNKLITGCNSTVIPESVVSIGSDAFFGCQFSSITIPAAVTSIGSISFMSCDQLSTIYAMMPTPANLDEGAFQDYHYTNATLYVPKGKKSAYQNAEVWSNFQNIVEMEPVAGYTQVGEQQITLTVEETKIQYGHAKFNIDKTVIASALGCNSDDIVEQILSSDGTLTDKANISPTIWGLNNIMISVDYGFWYNSEGYSDDYPTGVAAIVAVENEPSTYYLIQAPNSYHGGDNYSLDYYFTYDNKYYVYHIQVNVAEKPIKRLSEMTKVGGQEIVINEDLDTNYQFVPFDVDWEAITESLGCEQGEIVDMALNTDGELDDEFTANPRGFWFNVDGYVDKWGINAVMAITKENTYGIIQYPNALSSGESFAVNYYLTYEDKYYELNVVLNITIDPDDLINFADAEVKRICVENWDTNEDGELSYAEAAAVTDLGEVFKSNRTITSFDELAYFTNLTEIPNEAFYNCSALQTIVFPEECTSIGNTSFYNCVKLQSINISAAVNSIGTVAFGACNDLARITVSADNEVYDSRNNCNAIIQTATNTLIAGCKNTVIPNDIVCIGEYAFRGIASLEEITIPHSVTSIERFAFIGCNLASIIIPNSVTSITDYTFSGRTMASIVVEDDNPIYDSREGCNAIIETATNTLVVGCQTTSIPSSIKKIGSYSFIEIKTLSELVIPEGVSWIGSQAFAYSSLTMVSLPKTLETIWGYAFYGCNDLLTIYSYNPQPPVMQGDIFINNSYGKRDSIYHHATLYVPMGSKSAYQEANEWKRFSNIVEMEPDPNDFIYFADAEVKRICVENWDTNEDGELSYAEAAAVTDLGQVFKSNRTITSFNELAYFTNLTEIPIESFRLCTSLQSVVLPENLQRIGLRAFMESKLQSILIPNNVQVIDGAAFTHCGLTTIFIPASVTSIGNFVFAGNSNMSTIVVDSNNPVYDSRNGCSAIINTSTGELIQGCKSTVIPDGIKSISEGAFEFVDIEHLDLPQSLERIGFNAFYGCTLKEIVFPEGLISIGRYSFNGCNNLTEFHIPQSVQYVDGSAIASCGGITSISVADGNTKYNSVAGSNAITNKDGTTLIMGCNSTVIPSTVKSIADESFRGRKNLVSIEIPVSVESIGRYAFCECYSLTSIIIPQNVTEICEYAFASCSSLKSVTVMRAEPISITDNTFNYKGETILYVPVGSKTAYEAADVWKDFKEIIEVVPDNYLYANEATIQLGGKKTIALQLDNVKTLIAGEFRMQLPTGFSIEKDENNNLIAELVGGRINNHTLEVRDEGNGLYHFLCYSGQNRPIKGNSGNFITFSLVADDAVEEGSFAVELKGIVFSDENEQRIELTNSTFNITILDYTPGDVNDDGGLDVMDIVKMVSQIMGKNPVDFVFAAADIDGNGKVNVMDLVNLVEMVMTVVNQSPASTAISQEAAIYSGLTLGKADDNTIALNVPDASNHIAAQFFITLSGNATLRDVVSDKAHQSRFTRLDDGRYWVMVYSNSNASFKNDSPIQLQVNGNCNAKVEEVIFVDGDEHPIAFEPAALSTTGILAIGSYFDQPTDIYSVNGKLIKKAATSTLGLAKGVYVVNNEKVIIK